MSQNGRHSSAECPRWPKTGGKDGGRRSREGVSPPDHKPDRLKSRYNGVGINPIETVGKARSAHMFEMQHVVLLRLSATVNMPNV